MSWILINFSFCSTGLKCFPWLKCFSVCPHLVAGNVEKSALWIWNEAKVYFMWDVKKKKSLKNQDTKVYISRAFRINTNNKCWEWMLWAIKKRNRNLFFLTRGQIFLELWEITLKFDYPGFELLTMWLSASYLTFGALILSCVTHKETIIEFIW